MAGESTSSGAGAQIRQLSDFLYEVYKQQSTPTVQILLFHGLPSGDLSDAHLLTWKTENGSRLWEWLAEEFPGAHIFTVSYHGWVRNADMYIIGENLAADLILSDIGQFPYRPVILVGHCVGGLVIKEVCSKVYDRLHSSTASKKEVQQLGKFLENLRGIFYYSTPHHGSSRIAHARSNGPLLEYSKILNKDAARLNYKFDELRGSYRKLQIYGLGESLPIESGIFCCFSWCFRDVEVPEASSREGDCYHVVAADHNSICQPRSKIDRRFSLLKELIDNTVTMVAAEEARVQEQKRVEQEAIREEARRLEAYPENFQHLPLELTGVEEQVQEIICKLDAVKILCLTGMGGSGKTTLAMAVFNKLCPKFEFTCFVENIKLITGSLDDAKNAILKRLHQGGKRVEERYNVSSLRGKKVLLVLDDISERENKILSHFADVVALESRFIVTCRQQGLLRISNVVHKVYLLNEDSAKLLLMKCAFPGKEVPPVQLESLSGAIVKQCDGLPLTLEVLGKYLENDQSHEYWEQSLNALEKVEDVAELNESIWAKLRLSYDGLGRVEQQMFLDATTFFSRNSNFWTLGEAKSAWRAAYKTGSEGLQWKTLVDRSLVYPVEDYENIKVHEQLQSLGRKIASEPGSYGDCRLWDGEADLEMLQTTNELDGKEIHALCLGKFRDQGPEDADLEESDFEGDETIHISKTALQNLDKLQFLETSVSVIIDGAMEGASFPTRLVLLSCVGHHSLFDPVLQTQLAVLKLCHLEYLPGSIANLSCLNHLQIRGCKDLCFQPEFFSKLSLLRALRLEYCQGFQSLPESIKYLSSLKDLEVFSCYALCTLPESFGQLSSLDYIQFRDCPALQTLPESFGQLSSLRLLKFSKCRTLQSLPDSFRQLSSLFSLEFSICKALHTFPDSFGQLSSLSYLVFSDCDALHTLPKTFGQLSSLRYLTFSNCNALHTLAESFGQLSSLSLLEFSNCNALHSLPESFGQLSLLQNLKFSNCSNLAHLPESFGQLSSLRNLKFSNCSNLAHLPESFGQLSSLCYLEFLDCLGLQTLSGSFGPLSSLRHIIFPR